MSFSIVPSLNSYLLLKSSLLWLQRNRFYPLLLFFFSASYPSHYHGRARNGVKWKPSGTSYGRVYAYFNLWHHWRYATTFSLHNRKYAVKDTPLQNVTTSFCSWLVKRALWKKNFYFRVAGQYGVLVARRSADRSHLWRNHSRQIQEYHESGKPAETSPPHRIHLFRKQ